jgi:hypothetical protein
MEIPYRKDCSQGLEMYIRTYSLFKSGCLSINIKFMLHKALIRLDYIRYIRVGHKTGPCTATIDDLLIRLVRTYACPTCEYTADAHVLKLQWLQNRELHATENLDRRTAVCELHVNFKIPHLCDYMIKLCRTQAKVILNHVNPKYVELHKEKPFIGSIRGLNLAVVRLMTAQLTKCCFRVIK